MLIAFISRYRKFIALFCISLVLFLSLSISSVARETHSQEKAGSPLDRAAVLSNQGYRLYQAGQFEEAVESWHKAAALYREKGDLEDSRQNSLNAAEALYEAGFYLKGCDVLLSTFDLAEFDCRQLIRSQNQKLKQDVASAIERLDTSSVTVRGLRSLGDILIELNTLELANPILARSLQQAEELAAIEEVNAVLLSLGNLNKSQGDAVRFTTRNASDSKTKNLYYSCSDAVEDETAVDYYRQASNFYSQVTAKSNSSIIALQAKINQLGLQMQLGNRSQVQQLWLQIKPLLKIPASRTVNYARLNLAEKLLCYRQADKTQLPSDRDIEKLLNNTLATARDSGDEIIQSYSFGYIGRWQQQNNEIARAIASTQQALVLAEANNAPDLAYQWEWQLGYIFRREGKTHEAISAYTEAVNDLQSLRNDLAALTSQVQFNFRQRVEPIYRELVDLLLQSQPSQAHLASARQTIESLQLIELENYFRQACLDPKTDLDRIVDTNSSTAVIYPIILLDRLEIIVKSYDLPLLNFTVEVEQDKLQAIADALRADLLDVTKTVAVKQNSQQLYQWLIAPIETTLAKNQIDTLVFVLDGSLRNIPMSVLYDDERGYLIEKYAIALAPGLQLVESQPFAPERLNVLTAGISQSITVGDRRFAPLGNVEQELAEIQSQVAQSEQMIDRDFTRANLEKQLERTNFSTVHLATHGKFSSDPEETFILTWDRLLKTQDLANMMRQYNLKENDTIELLVLSACETASGDSLATLGLAGIAVRAGVKSTLASLWFVDDRYSAEIMSNFYRELSKGATKAKALQKAQISILNQEERPYLWSSFILLGNWL